MKIPLFRPMLGKRSRDYLETALQDGRWASGPHVKVFEDELARYTGYDQVVAVSSGTMAARLLWIALGRQRHGFVTGTSLTFASPYLEAQELGYYVPGFIDIDRYNWCLEPSEITFAPWTNPIVVVCDYGGWPSPTPSNEAILWIRDAAHRVAPGMAREGAPVALFVFHPTKPVAGLGGGAIALAGEYAHLEADLRRLRDFGRTRDGPSYTIEQYGTNGYMTNVSAAVALGSLEDLAETTAQRWEIAGQYMLDLPKAFSRRILSQKCSYYLYPVLLPRGASRALFVAQMAARGVEVGIHYPPVHQLKIFAKPSKRILPVAEDVGARIVSLPCWAGMSSDEVSHVCESATEFLRRTDP